MSANRPSVPAADVHVLRPPRRTLPPFPQLVARIARVGRDLEALIRREERRSEEHSRAKLAASLLTRWEDLRAVAEGPLPDARTQAAAWEITDALECAIQEVNGTY